MNETDAAVIDRVREGDTDAFRLLVERHSRAIFRLAFRLTRNETDADDVVQETFLRAYRNLKRFDGRSSFSTWAHQIATNCALDLLRRHRRNPTEELDDERPVADTRSSQERLVLKVGLAQALEHGMKALSGNERTAFVLRHYEGMTIDEIGRVLGTETNATKHTIFRAVRKLRQILEPLVATT
jgi:RNA polymerase sigma-70 factor (ECF subfamily)